MARLRYNNAVGTLGASLTNSGTTITFASAPSFATITSPDFIPIVLEPAGTSPSANFEIVHLTAYTAGATTGTIVRGQEGTTGVAHSNGVAWACGPVQVDAYENYAVFTSSGSWAIPAGVTAVKIRVVGGGGGGAGGEGGSTAAGGTGGAGGGAGMVVEDAFTLNGSDTSLTITVGAGGSGGNAGVGGASGAWGVTNATGGGASQVKGATSAVIYAEAAGGNFGYQNNGGGWGGTDLNRRNSSGTFGGIGDGGPGIGNGIGSIAGFNIVGGGAGGSGNSTNGGGAGGSNTALPVLSQNPGNTGTAAGTTGANASTASIAGCGGGGGGGGAYTANGGTGAAGAAGLVEIWW